MYVANPIKAKYGCTLCADRKKCKAKGPCEYADSLDEYDSYADYEKKSEDDWRRSLLRALRSERRKV